MLNISFSINESEYNTILISEMVELNATVTGGTGTHTFVWKKYNKNTINMTTDDFALDQSYTTDGLGKTKLQYDEAGEYLVELTVNDQYGNNISDKFYVNVVEEKGCADLNMFIVNCDEEQVNILKDQTVRFEVISDLSNCGYSKEVGKISWSMKTPTKSKFLGCSYIGDIDIPQLVDLTRCIHFREAGRHTIYAKIYPYHNSSPITIMNNEETSSVISKTIMVHETDVKSESIGSTNALFEAAALIEQNDLTYYSNILIESNDQTPIETIDPLNQNNKKIRISASKDITIKPPFEAKYNSDLNLRIKSLPNTNCNECVHTKFSYGDGYPHSYVPSDAINITLEKVNCRIWDGGDLEYGFYVDRWYSGPYFGRINLKCLDGINAGICAAQGYWLSTIAESNHTYSEPFNQIADRAIYGEVTLDGNGTSCKSNAIVIGKTKCNVGPTIVYSKSSSSDSIFTAHSPTDIRFLSKVNFSLYPNPTESDFTLEITGDHTTTQSIEIYNKIGQIVYSIHSDIQKKNRINVLDWPEGVYFVRLITKNGSVEIKKLVKN